MQSHFYEKVGLKFKLDISLWAHVIFLDLQQHYFCHLTDIWFRDSSNFKQSMATMSRLGWGESVRNKDRDHGTGNRTRVLGARRELEANSMMPHTSMIIKVTLVLTITSPNPDASPLLTHRVTESSMTQWKNTRFILFLAQWACSGYLAVLGFSFLINNVKTLT